MDRVTQASEHPLSTAGHVPVRGKPLELQSLRRNKVSPSGFRGRAHERFVPVQPRNNRDLSRCHRYQGWDLDKTLDAKAGRSKL